MTPPTTTPDKPPPLDAVAVPESAAAFAGVSTLFGDGDGDGPLCCDPEDDPAGSDPVVDPVAEPVVDPVDDDGPEVVEEEEGSGAGVVVGTPAVDGDGNRTGDDDGDAAAVGPWEGDADTGGAKDEPGDSVYTILGRLAGLFVVPE